MRNSISILLILLLIVGCATGPEDQDYEASAQISPQELQAKWEKDIRWVLQPKVANAVIRVLSGELKYVPDYSDCPLENPNDLPWPNYCDVPDEADPESWWAIRIELSRINSFLACVSPVYEEFNNPSSRRLGYEVDGEICGKNATLVRDELPADEKRAKMQGACKVSIMDWNSRNRAEWKVASTGVD